MRLNIPIYSPYNSRYPALLGQSQKEEENFSGNITNRKQYVKIGNVESSLKTITCGVPQGSTLGPLLSLLYLNDLLRSSKKLTFRIFADDTNMLYSTRGPERLQSTINEELLKVLKFCAANMLSIKVPMK